MSRLIRGYPRDLASTRGKVFLQERGLCQVVGHSVNTATGELTLAVTRARPGFGTQVFRLRANSPQILRVRPASLVQ